MDSSHAVEGVENEVIDRSCACTFCICISCILRWHLGYFLFFCFLMIFEAYICLKRISDTPADI